MKTVVQQNQKSFDKCSKRDADDDDEQDENDNDDDENDEKW